MITINFNQFEYAVATCPAAGMAGDTHIHCATTTCRQTFFEANWTAI